jgi:hypothetical protein
MSVALWRELWAADSSAERHGDRAVVLPAGVPVLTPSGGDGRVRDDSEVYDSVAVGRDDRQLEALRRTLIHRKAGSEPVVPDAATLLRAVDQLRLREDWDAVTIARPMLRMYPT